MAAAVITLLPFHSKNTRQAALRLELLGSIVFVSFSVLIAFFQTPFTLQLWQATPELRLSLNVDRLSAFFMLLISLVSGTIVLYSMSYIEHYQAPERRKGLMIALMGVFILAMLLLTAADNAFAFLFFWEIMSTASFFLIIFDFEKKESQKAGLFYFVMTQMSTVFLLFGFLALFGLNGSFEMKAATDIPPLMKTAIFAALFTSFSIKAGVMPFHKWLPYAYSASPSNISAMLSGVMKKVAIYGMVRYLLFVLEPDLSWGVTILIFGLFSAGMGIIYALKEHDIKKLLAYSSIENTGIILLGIGLYIIFRGYGQQTLAELGLLGALFHAFNHALFKSLLFLTAGSVVEATGTRNIEEMGGLLKRMPYTGVLFLIGAAAISALPPLNGFVSELVIFQAFLQSFIVTSPFLKVLLLLGLSMFAMSSAMAALCFVKAFGTIFLAQPRSRQAAEAREAPSSMLIGPAILAALCVLTGVFSSQIFSFLGFNPGIPNLAVTGLVLVLALAITLTALRFGANRQQRVSETWGCGITSQNKGMEYTATGYSEPILTIFKPIYRTRKLVERTYLDNQKAVFKEGRADIQTLKIFEEKIYLPIAHFIEKLSKIIAEHQDVDLDVYILYSLITVVILLIAVGWTVQ